MSSDKRCCVPGCKNTDMHPVLHGFPNPEKDRLRFNTWLYSIGRDILRLENAHIFKYRRVCHRHFHDKYICRNNRISRTAIPTLYLPGLNLATQSQSKLPCVERKALQELVNQPMPSTSTDRENDETYDIELLDDWVEPPVPTNPDITNTAINVTEALPEPDPALELDIEPTLSPEVSESLGDLMTETPKYGPALNKDLARIWNTILKNGLPRENNMKLEKNVPENCCLLKAPLLNPEIIATVNDTIINRDKKMESEQNQLGVGLTILGDALSMLINNNNIDRLKLISQLSDAGRVLTDLHCTLTKSRKNLIFPVLDKKFLDTVKEVERDDYLYGKNLSEKTKVLQTCQKMGQSIKKPTSFTTTGQGNLSGPSRYNQQRTNLRPGHKKPQSSCQARKYNQYQPQHGVRKPKAPPTQDKTRVRH